MSRDECNINTLNLNIEGFISISTSSSSIHQGTPTIKVQDNQGVTIRTLECYRTTTEDPPEIRLIQQNFSAIGNPLSQQDPRLTTPISFIKHH